MSFFNILKKKNSFCEYNDYKKIIELLDSEYIIFLTNKFYCILKKKLLKFFDKYNILYLSYTNKNIFLNLFLLVG